MANELRRAGEGDLESILDLMRAYYAEEGYPFDRERSRRALSRLVVDRELGSVWVVDLEGVVAGYLVVTFGFSLEYGGRDAFVDELYLEESVRGRGLGRRALDAAVELCRRRGAGAVHLEVEMHREAALGLYRSSGFEATGRRLLTKRLADEG